MSFNANITFTGVCTFVPNLDGSKCYVLLPNGEQGLGSSESIDRTALKRHRGFVRFSVKDLAYAAGITAGIEEGMVGLWYLKRTMDEGGSEAEQGRELVLNCPGVQTPFRAVELDKVADLESFAPNFCTVDSALLEPDRRALPASIVMRMLIDRGTLRAGSLFSEFRIPNTLNGVARLDSTTLRPPSLAHELVLELKGLTGPLQLTALPFPDGEVKTLSLAAPAKETIELTIANFCDDNPLQWTRSADTQPDVDFKWHFHLLGSDKRTELQALLSGIELPIPIPFGHINGSGANCYPAKAKAGDF
jgi:hypothetical protein